MGCECLIFMFPTALSSGERQRKKTQITNFSFSDVAMIQTIGISDAFMSPIWKNSLCSKKIDFTKCHIQTKVSDDLSGKGAMAFAGINKT